MKCPGSICLTPDMVKTPTKLAEQKLSRIFDVFPTITPCVIVDIDTTTALVLGSAHGCEI